MNGPSSRSGVLPDVAGLAEAGIPRTRDPLVTFPPRRRSCGVGDPTYTSMKTLVLLLAAGLLTGARLSAAETALVWKGQLPKDPAWLHSDAARSLADNLLAYQYPSGGWPKNIDMAKPLTPSERAALSARKDDEATIDNGATHTQIRALAQIYRVTEEPRYRVAVERGTDYLLAAQYPNGGWPQFFPLRKGYYTHITFNDDAMIGALEVVDEVAAGREPFTWMDSTRRSRAADAVTRAIDCILKCQIVTNGLKTAWCAQHDEVTFAPAPARKFEPACLTGSESVGILRYLMRLPTPSPEIIASVQAGVAWFESVKRMGIRFELVAAPDQPKGTDRVVIADPKAGPIWARFYEIGTNRPIFIGRDAIVRYALAEIEHERRVGYTWYNDSAKSLLEREYPRWAARWIGRGL